MAPALSQIPTLTARTLRQNTHAALFPLARGVPAMPPPRAEPRPSAANRSHASEFNTKFRKSSFDAHDADTSEDDSRTGNDAEFYSSSTDFHFSAGVRISSDYNSG
eukprot:2779067-Pleurochrysis_carterae.AAC.2